MDRQLKIGFKDETDVCMKAACTVPGMLSHSFTKQVGGFASNNYWSSTENNANNAWKQNFNNGNQNNNNKNNNNYVRCVRSFNQNTESDAHSGKQLELDFSTSETLQCSGEIPDGFSVSKDENGGIELFELFEAYYECRKNKRNTANALHFELDYESNLVELHREINNGTYQPGRSIAFIVKKPVQREIFAADFRDRIVHHLIIGKLNSYFEKYFINDSYSCRVGKGTHYGIKRAQGFIRAASNNYTSEAWVLKLDIEAFFMNINKSILFKKLNDFIEQKYLAPDKELIVELCRKIIFSDCRDNCFIKGNRKNWKGLPATKSLFGKPANKGIPIGNLTSQVFANFYLSALDHFIKHELGIKYYGRYVDDMILIHPDKEYLKHCTVKIEDFLITHLDLSLHPKKKYLQHFSKGVAFLGCYVKPECTYVNKRTKANFYAAIAKHNFIIRQTHKINYQILKQFVSTINSYLGIMKHYDTYKLRKKMIWKYLSGYYFNYIYISGNYGKVVTKIKYISK